MDPAAMDFVMHRSPTTSNRGALSPMALDAQQSPCPALRAAAENNQLPSMHAHPRGGNGSHYDPVHSSNWWQHNPHDTWQHPPYTPHMNSRHMPMYSHAPAFAGPPGLAPPTVAPQINSQQIPPFAPGGAFGDYYAAHGHPHAHGHSPTRFSQRLMIPPLDRLGGAGASQYGQSTFPAYPGSAEHVSRSRLPALAQISPNFGENASGREFTPRADFGGGQSGSPERLTVPRPSSSSVTMPPMRQRMADSALDASRIVVGSTRDRHRAPTASSDSLSDDDSDSNEAEMITARLLDTITAGGGPEGGLRAAQLLRGTTSGRKVASRKAVAALQSVKIEDLPESERTCIICYNDFGTETPEGINEAALRLPKCQHVFGDHCIKKWFAESDSCPYCRDKLPSEPQPRHAPPEAVIQLMRHHAHAFRQHAREAASRESADENAWMGPDGSTHRNPLPSVRGYASFDRRSPPGDTGENRRRTRPRHSSLRGTPPTIRPLQYGAPAPAGPSSSQFHAPRAGFYPPPNHLHRHSAGALSSPLLPRFSPSEGLSGHEHNGSTFLSHAAMFQPPESPRLAFPNPLGANGTEAHNEWPSMRQELYTPVTNTHGGPDVRMADSEGAARTEGTGNGNEHAST